MSFKPLTTENFGTWAFLIVIFILFILMVICAVFSEAYLRPVFMVGSTMTGIFMAGFIEIEAKKLVY